MHVAVHDLDLEVTDGEFAVLVGPSGCGKSTTLRMIAGLESISAGQLLIDGRVVNDLAAKDRDIAMVFQNYALYPHMTVKENMAFALRLRRLPPSQVDRQVQEAAAILGIEKLLERRPRQLSGGERQRVALGRAIVRQPKVFLFDEPLSNLDAKLRVQMRREIARLHRHLGTTMIYVTHDQVEALTLGDRIAVLDQGRLQQVATPTGLYERPRNTFVAGFIGTPPMNLVPGEALRDGEGRPRFEARGGGFRLALDPASGKVLGNTARLPVVLGVRPEDIRVGLEAPASGSTFLARVDLVELLGGEALVHLSREGIEITARIPAPPVPTCGGELQLSVAPGRIHLFDAEGGQRLAPG